MTVMISVIIPVFNAQDWIGEAIRSVMKQTWQNFEIIVCDDKSTDATISEVEALTRHDPRIRLLTNAVNRGVSYARNVAIEAAIGDWIAILDADDYFHPRRLETLHELAQVHDADLVCDDVIIVSSCGMRILGTVMPSGEVTEATELSAASYIVKSSRLRHSYGYLQPFVRKRFIDRHTLRYDQSLSAFEDYDFTARCLIKGGKCILTKQAFYYLRLTPNSLSRTERAGWFELSESVDQALLHMPEVRSNPELVRVLHARKNFFMSIYEYNLIGKWIKSGNLWRALKESLAHLSALPLFIRIFFRNMVRRIRRWPDTGAAI